MSKQGWISLHRKIQDNILWQDKPFSKGQAWIDLLLSANHKKNEVLLGNEVIEVEPGQFVTSIRKLADRWGWSNTKINNFFKLLEKKDMATKKSDTKKTVIKVHKYKDYQGLTNYKNDTKTHQKHNENTSKTYQKHTNNNDNNDLIMNNNDINIYVDKIEKVYNCWIEYLSDVNEARLTKKQKKTILTKIKKWSADDIIKAIKNYNEVYRSDYYYSHNFTMQKFIEQSNGVPRFLEGLDQEYDGDIWKDYNNKKTKKNKIEKNYDDILDL